jgi:DNA-binding FadR family transcriptional regulator
VATGADSAERFLANRDFHRVVLEASGNRLLGVVAEPLFRILQTRFLRDKANARFWQRVVVEHEAVARAIAVGDPDAASRAMVRHLRSLRKTYESIDSAPDKMSRVQSRQSAVR